MYNIIIKLVYLSNNLILFAYCIAFVVNLCDNCCCWWGGGWLGAGLAVVVVIEGH